MQDDLSGKSTIRELSIDMISRFFCFVFKMEQMWHSWLQNWPQ